MNPTKKFPTKLKRLKYEIEQYARDYGLDFFDVVFEILDYDQVNVAAANTGFLARYPHWRFGMEWEKMHKMSKYGLSKIYEMVINSDPCYAYLLEGNGIADQKLVIAHVYGHCDFFKNNLNFEKTNRKMHDQMANHRVKIEKYIDLHGPEKIENFIDSCLSLENLIDYHSLFFKRSGKEEVQEANMESLKIPVEEGKGYLDSYVNPKSALEAQKKQLEQKKQEKKAFPAKPQLDVLQFLFEHSEVLEEWQKDILWMIREEAYYFSPQARTKIMNEGWAAYWHSRIMTEKAMKAEDVVDYADHCSAVFQMRDRINPYKLGIELYRYIDYKWNTGRHNKAHEECDDFDILDKWDEFVIFKNLYERSKKNKKFNLEESLTEFFTFKECLKDGKMGLIKGMYRERDIPKYWEDYRKAQMMNKHTTIKEIEEEVNQARKDIPLFNHFVNFYKKTEHLKLKEGPFETFKNFFSAEKLGPVEKKHTLEELADAWNQYPAVVALMKRYKVLDHFLRIKSKIPLFDPFIQFKKRYAEGSIERITKKIPEKWFAYADRYPGEILLGAGQKKIFEVRRDYNDITFLDTFIDDQFCKEQKIYYYNEKTDEISYDSSVIKNFLTRRLVNAGNPYIYLVDGNYKNRKELLFVHKYTGMELDERYAIPTMKNLYTMWGRPVNLIVTNGEDIFFRRYDGSQYDTNLEGRNPKETAEYFLKVNDRKIISSIIERKKRKKQGLPF